MRMDRHTLKLVLLASAVSAILAGNPQLVNTLTPVSSMRMGAIITNNIAANTTTNSSNASNATQPPAPAAVATPSPSPKPEWVQAETKITGGDVMAGSTEIPVKSTEGFQVGNYIRINPGGMNEEDNKIKDFASIILNSPLQFTHGVGEKIVSIQASESDYVAPSVGRDFGFQEKVAALGVWTVVSFLAAAFGIWFLLVYIINLFEGKTGVAALPFGSCCAQNRKYDQMVGSNGY